MIVMCKIFDVAEKIITTNCVHVEKQNVLKSLREVRNRMWVNGNLIYPKAKLHEQRKSPYYMN